MGTRPAVGSDVKHARRAQRLALVQLELMAWGLALVIGVGIAETLGVLVAALYLVPTVLLAALTPVRALRGRDD
jgi:hypothetical protein